MPKTKTKKWNQKVSEYVGKGHPDLVADEISAIITRHAIKSASEVLISRKGLFITGETEFATKEHEKAAKKEIKELLQTIASNYNGNFLKVHKVKFNFVKQDAMLAGQRANLKAGDQEVAYVVQLDENDIHWHLRKWDNDINTHLADFLDYKVLVDMNRKKANISVSTSHCHWMSAVNYLIEHITQLGIKEEDINIVKFLYGSWHNDTGVTGRKLIVEQGGCGYPHGGGAVYGKDATKTAPKAHELGQEQAFLEQAKIVEVVFFPGDYLNKPTITTWQKGKV